MAQVKQGAEASDLTLKRTIEVSLALPKRDEAALTQAFLLATTVHVELVNSAPSLNFDEFMLARRGRIWSP